MKTRNSEGINSTKNAAKMLKAKTKRQQRLNKNEPQQASKYWAIMINTYQLIIKYNKPMPKSGITGGINPKVNILHICPSPMTLAGINKSDSRLINPESINK